jgi:hypothetical protein
MPTKTDVVREFQRFINAVGFSNPEQLQAVMEEMKETARDRGMSEDEMATIYDADELFDIYLETLDRRH